MPQKPSKDIFSKASKFLVKKLERLKNPPPVVAAIRLDGVIGAVGRYSQGLSMASLAGLLKRAGEQPRLKAIALIINSPGGAPAQASLIAQRIRLVAEEKDVPVLAFVEDVAASGGYWLACAADEIYGQESSIVGSIGVVSASFGFHEIIEKLGIERRVHSQGKHKAILDPFKPEKKEDVAILENIQKEIHSQFKKYVKQSRGKKLKGKEDTLFSGLFWTGVEAKKLGLIDGIGEIRSTCQEKFGEKVEVRLIRGSKPLIKQLFSSQKMGENADIGESLVSALESRAHWQRFGL